MEYANAVNKLCLDCEHGKQRFKGSCYCTKYGFIIGYPKSECRGYEREQVQESKNDCGRNHVRQQEGSEPVGRIETA